MAPSNIVLSHWQAVYDAVVRAGRRVRCEATCGAGLPVLVTLDRMLAAGDEIQRIAGALSGGAPRS